MRTMSGGFCLHYDCSNRNSFGYCKTTVCINKHYQQEQWGSLSTTNKSESVVIKPLTNGDRIRSMTDEELAKKMSGLESFALTCGGGWPPEKWLEWLRKEAEVDNNAKDVNLSNR